MPDRRNHLEVRLQRCAETDLVDIWLFTSGRWGEAQADIYLDVIHDGIQQLARNPALGKACPDIRSGYRCLPVAQHLVFYRITSSCIRVIRVLHKRRCSKLLL